MGIEGVVRFKLGIDEKGNVVRVKITDRAGHGFDEAASRAVQRARFKPAIGTDGRPVPCNIPYTYRFEIPE
jgi:protein TonB